MHLVQLYPFWSQGIVGTNPLKAIEFFAGMPPGDTTTTININNQPDKAGTKTDTVVKNHLLGNLLAGSLVKNVPLPAAITDSKHPPLALYFDNNSMEDLWIAITWGK